MRKVCIYFANQRGVTVNMLCSKLLQNILWLNSLKRSCRTISNLTCSSNVLANYSGELHKQYLNCRYVANYKRNWNDEQASNPSKAFIWWKYLRLIKNAIYESGPVIELNPRLACAIKKAKDNKLPPDYIKFAIKISCDNRAIVGSYDVLLPNECHFIVQYHDIDSTITKYHLLRLCEKFDGTLFQGETIWHKSFEQKGFILLPCRNSDSLSCTPKETLFKIGVESYLKESDAEGTEYWKLYCDPWQLPEVKNQICKITNNIEEAYVGYLPKKQCKISPHIRNSILSTFVQLCEIPTIDNVFVNVNFKQ